MTPMRAGRLSARVMTGGLGAVAAEQRGGHGLGTVAGILEDRRHLGIGHERRPTLLVPVEDGPHAALVAGIAEDGRALRAVEGPLVGALLAEHGEELVD